MTLASQFSLSLGRTVSPQQYWALTGLDPDGRRVHLTFPVAGGRSPLFGKASQ